MITEVILDQSAKTIVTNLVKADEPNLIPENIKKDVDILGVIGTYSGPTPTPTTYTITCNVTHGNAAGDSTIVEGGEATVTITPESDYELPDSITVEGVETNVYNSTTGVITLSNPTSNVTITVVCQEVAETFTITGNITNGTLTGATSVTGDDTVTCTIVPSAGYTLPASADVTVTGATGSYDDQTGEISISHVLANVTVTATCPAEQPQALTAIEVSDTLTSIKFDTNLTPAEVVAILSTLTYNEDGFCALVSDSNIGGDGIVYCYSFEDNDKQYYNITVMTNYEEHDGATEISVFTDNTVNDGTGWEIDTDTIPLTITPTITAVDQTAGWNGVVVGK